MSRGGVKELKVLIASERKGILNHEEDIINDENNIDVNNDINSKSISLPSVLMYQVCKEISVFCFISFFIS